MPALGTAECTRAGQAGRRRGMFVALLSDFPQNDMNTTGALSSDRLRGIRRGIEKESLRALPTGALALTPHPAALGSALTHPHITTDYSESQLELITGVHAGVEACLDELTQVHQFTYRVMRELGDEM